MTKYEIPTNPNGFMQRRERVAASQGKLLYAISLPCAISVVKVDHVHDTATRSHVQREISDSVATNGPF